MRVNHRRGRPHGEMTGVASTKNGYNMPSGGAFFSKGKPVGRGDRPPVVANTVIGDIEWSQDG